MADIMKKGFLAACLLSIAASAVVVVYAYRNDDKVRETVDGAVKDVSEFVGVIRDRVNMKKQDMAAHDQEATQRNQAWADQQWEALGI